MKRLFLNLVIALCAAGAFAQSAPNAEPKVLRVAFSAAETSFDPQRIVDLYSRTVTPHIFEALYAYDHLARPSKIKPLLADGMPEASSDFRVWTVKVKRGIYFADDPAFKGQRREVVAEDFAYVFKRVVDPANRSPIVPSVLELKLTGLNALRDDALKHKKPFDYDKPVEGLQVLDRYTIRFKVDSPLPRFLEYLAQSDLLGAVAREVVEHYKDDIDAHPVGTGPFRLKQWRRSSLIVLERNPQFREMLYDAEPAPDDREGQAILARFKGRRIPMIDEVQISIIDEDQPLWLSFLNREIDMIGTQASPLPREFVNTAIPGGKLAPHFAKQGMQFFREVSPDVALLYFNMEHPVVGGYTPDKVALRRAISLAIDVDREIRTYWNHQAIPAQSPVVPHTTGYDVHLKSEMSDYNAARAKALLDMHGYVDRDGDGWREMPDGSPLVLDKTTQPDLRSRQRDEQLRKALEPIGLRITFSVGQWPENLKAARAGKLMMWMLGFSAAAPDGQGGLARLYGPQAGGQNLARFKHAEFDRIYDRMLQIPDGPEREALFLEAKKIAVAFMPYKYHVHRIESDLVYPWLIGYRRPVFWQEWFHMVDLDPALRARRAR